MFPGLRFVSFAHAEEAANITHAWICKKLRLRVADENEVIPSLPPACRLRRVHHLRFPNFNTGGFGRRVSRLPFVVQEK